MQQSDASRSLVDMPAAWLHQLPTAVSDGPGRSLVPLFSCCRALRDLVLSQRSVLLCFRLPLQPEAAQVKLLLACKYSSTVDLLIAGGNDERIPDNASHLMTSTMAAAGQALSAIKDVTLRGLELDALVPSWLNTTCPNLRSLGVCNCQITGLPLPTVSIPQCPQLKELELCLESSQLPRDEPALLRWQHQLRALPGLNSLSLTDDDDTRSGWQQLRVLVGLPSLISDLQHQFLLQCCSAIGSQLTQLSLMSAQLDLHQLVTLFPRVEDLQLPDLMVGDEGMEALLSMGGLRQLQCKGFQLQQSYTNRPCAWTHLGFTELDVTSFGHLPLGASLQFSGALVETIIPSQHPATNASVAAMVVKHGVQWGSHVDMNNNQVHASTACLAALMPMLSACKSRELTVSHVKPVTPELLAAMRQHLGPAACVRLIGCTLCPAAWPLLLPSLPPTVKHFPWQLRVSRVMMIS